MAHFPTIAWYVEKYILLVTYPSDFVEDDLEAIVSAKPIVKMMDEGQGALVHIVQDFRLATNFQLTRLARLVEVNQHPKRALLYQHPKLGWIVDVAEPNHSIRYFDSVVTQMYGARYRFFSTLEDAVSFLRHVDSTIPD